MKKSGKILSAVLACVMLIIYLMRSLLRYIACYTIDYLGVRVMIDLRQKVFSHFVLVFFPGYRHIIPQAFHQGFMFGFFVFFHHFGKMRTLANREVAGAADTTVVRTISPIGTSGTTFG